MKSSGMLKWLMIPILGLVIFAGIQLFSHKAKNGASSGELAGRQLSAQESKDLGVGGDTPHDTISTLIGQVKQLRTEVQESMTDARSQKEENARLRVRESSVDARIQSTLEGELNRLNLDREQTASTQQQTQSLLETLQHRVDTLSGKPSHEDLPIGLGLEGAKGESDAEEPLHWYEPADRAAASNKATTTPPTASHQGFSLPGQGGLSEGDSRSTPVIADGSPTSMDSEPGKRTSALNNAKQVYTVPANATLMGSTAMTALIGRVPVDGAVSDAYPFKIVVGADNLTANGIQLPDVAGAIVSGTASGDWTLSCVRGQVRSITFVFQDGTVRTLPAGAAASEVDASSTGAHEGISTGSHGGLGWISDPYGIPCISGVRRSNAAQYLSTQMLITAAAAGAAASISSKDSSNVTYISGGSSSDVLGTVGINGNEAAGRILASGVQEMSRWVDRLYGQALAVIYVQPGAQVAVHIDQPLEIDYEPHGRRVRYATGAIHESDMD